MNRPFLAVCFDHDGTLVDSEPIHYRLWRDVLAPHGVDFTQRQYQESHAGVPTAENAHDLVQRHALAVDGPALADQKHAAMTRFIEREAFPLMPDVPACVAQLHAAGLRLAVVTGAVRVSAQATLREHALAPYFELVVTAEDVARNKPAPDVYLLAAQRLGLAPAQCVAIEDSAPGVAAAAAAGMACVAIPHAISRHHDFSLATVVVDSLPQAVAWIEARSAVHAR